MIIYATNSCQPIAAPRIWCLTTPIADRNRGGGSAIWPEPVDTLRVMTYNIWVGGHAAGLPLSRTVNVIQAANADVIGIQETFGSAQAIANELGFFYYDIDGDDSIISRFPITEIVPQGVKLQLSPEQSAYVFGVHLEPYPYEPYDIRDGFITTEAQAIASAQSSRGSTLANAFRTRPPPARAERRCSLSAISTSLRTSIGRRRRPTQG